MALKIGILTFQWADNYGGLLQCFALKKYLQDQGYDTTVLNYWPSYALKNRCTSIGKTSVMKQFGVLVKPNIMRLLKSILLGRYQNGKIITKENDQFREKYLTGRQRVFFDNSEVNQELDYYDVLICGSDQIWNPILTGGHFDKTYFLDFANQEVVKMSYAASLGVPLRTEWEQEFHGLLNGLNFISTRESSLSKMIQERFDLASEAVIDPVFLINASDWCQLMPTEENKSPYILVYSIHRGNEIISAANWLSKRTNLPIHVIGVRRNYHNAHYYDTCSLENFLYQFKYADYILTNSFHGTAFSLIFQKRFMTILESEKPSRVIDLLTDIGLVDRIYTSNNKTVILDSPDFPQVNLKLNNKIRKSKEFLNACITSAKDGSR